MLVFFFLPFSKEQRQEKRLLHQGQEELAKTKGERGLLY